jgi:hypothetical protein
MNPARIRVSAPYARIVVPGGSCGRTAPAGPKWLIRPPDIATIASGS